jgi:hypothetical protein
MVGQTYFEAFKSYYTHSDYAHRYVMSALDGNGDFTGKSDKARVQGVKKGSAYMNVWMYVIREMEDAIDDCKSGCSDCNDDPGVHAWDEAVAFYAGSLEGITRAKGKGVLLYNLADKRCANFKTCGADNERSKVNQEILALFNTGRVKLGEAKNEGYGAKCEAKLRPVVTDIVKWMAIPLIQGSLRYALIVANLNGDDKAKAEGAVFSAAILPLVHKCDATQATTISDNMKINAAVPMNDGFAKVKEAFESVYQCLGITCADIGGYYDSDNNAYYPGAAPCGPTPAPAPSDASGATRNWISFAALALAFLVSTR